ncbi:unnamed protein product [Danaus chrysippus]|uniref:AP-3 complex subunit beta n=1 Tax=Danaus chrysippus TaxID=151541 RepID=A0A8J2QRZ9_9NEOP|nr:unnamed protein product [Danaus chrysippus]
MSGTSSYNNEKVVQGEVEYPATDPASGAFFQPDYKKNEDLKLMLDGSKDSLKLEAMKRIIGLIAKGRDASDLFPAVVKNVVSKNLEVKKLVYVYLVRYAEEQQDLALLSISTFQRALKDPNQLIRASALRVLSSIRVPMIVPIVMLAIRDSASDMSPYVRKTAAHAIPKLYSLDPDQKEELVAIIDKLLSDKAPLVVGSAAMAFNEVCGDRMNLIHKSYRKLCLLLADVDEWGQLALLNVLTYYARTCFPDPNNEAIIIKEVHLIHILVKLTNYFSEFIDQSCSSDSDNSSGRHSPRVEADLRLVLRAAKPLLQSRNSAVVLAVAQLFYHCGPIQEFPPVSKSLVRLLRGPCEVQSVVLNTIASLTDHNPKLFEPYLKSFFVRNSDPTHIKLLKLEVLTNLASESSSAVLLREYQSYVSCGDASLAAATIHAIGRLALRVTSQTDTCLHGLLQLLSSKDEWVVCEAVVVVKRVVCGGASSARAAVSRAAKLLRSDRLAGGARAAAVWLVSEHGSQHARAAAVLAHMAGSFAEQDELVKLQLLSLCVKLWVSQPATRPVTQYVLSLARYDVSYDVRDRARFIRGCLEGPLARYVTDIFCPDTPKPSVQANNKERTQYTVGSLSQYIGSCACGYRPLPTAPSADTCAALRDSAPAEAEPDREADQQKNKNFYSEPGSSSSSSESSSEESTDDEDSNEADNKQEKTKQVNNYKSSSSGTSDSESDSSSSHSDEDSETDQQDGEEGEDEEPPNKQEPEVKDKNDKSNLELLLELDEVASSLPTMTPTCGGFLSPTTPTENEDDSIVPVGPTHVPVEVELVSRVRWSGLGVTRRWLRSPHLHSDKMVAVQLKFTNHGHEDVEDIRLEKKDVPPSRSIQPFPVIPRLAPGCSSTGLLGLDFGDTIHPMDLTFISSNGSVCVSLSPPVGELVRAVRVSPSVWTNTCNALRGMNECSKETSNPGAANISRRVLEAANLCQLEGSEEYRFSGRSMSSRSLILVSVTEVKENRLIVVVRCENIALANLMAGHIASALDG